MEFVRVERRGHVAIVVVDRPAARNALNSQVLDELGEAVSAVADARAVVLTGAGERAFVAGADIAAMRDFGSTEAAAFSAKGQGVLDALEGLAAPVVAAVNGYALGGGCELAMACDLVLASARAVFGQPEVSLGVIPGFGGTQRLVRRVGSMRARELLYTGRLVKADEAVAIGLALRVVDPVLDAAVALATQIAAQAPTAVCAAKRAVLDSDGADLRTGLAGERNLFALLFGTGDQKEGMTAFLEKRAAVWSGS